MGCNPFPAKKKPEIFPIGKELKKIYWIIYWSTVLYPFRKNTILCAYKQRGGIITEKQEKRHQKFGKPSSKSLFPAHTEQISLLPEQAQKLHTSGRSNAGKSFSEAYFYLPRSSILLFVLDVNL